MRQDRMRESTNVDDRRGQRGMSIPGGGKMVMGGGIGGIGLVLVVLYLLLGGSPQQLLQQLPQQPGGGGLSTPGSNAPMTPEHEHSREFIARVLGDTEDVWTDLFAQMGRQYTPPTLVLFTDQVQSGCGYASAQTGPFYCPADMKVYIDLEFFVELDQRYGAPGDFAQAYVLAHEVGHHVQRLMGLTDRVDQARDRVSKAEYNDLSVRLELQADFLAGVWAHHAQKQRRILEPGDLDEGLRAASAVGDDHLQMESQGRIVPDAFTHGTSEQRARWFRKGFDTGDLSLGDTFAAANP